MLDGSALGWAMEVQFAGLRLAPTPEGGEDGVPRKALMPKQVGGVGKPAGRGMHHTIDYNLN